MIRLVKTSALLDGQQPVGAVFEVLGTADDFADELRVREFRIRAYRLLKRAMPDENTMEWTASA